MRTLLVWWFFLGAVLTAGVGARAAETGGGQPARENPAGNAKAFVIPIRDEIMPPLLYVVRRGVKEAIDQQASLIVLDMDTPGGRVDTTREILDILNEFKGETVTYVNKDAFSAGSYIAAGTRRIYMAPGSNIGAAAPIVLGPEGGVQAMPDTVEKKQVSAVRAMVRNAAERNGHNPAVLEAMIDKTKGLEIDGTVISEKGELLTLTSSEAEKEYGNPPKKLLSAGTVDTLDQLLKRLGYSSDMVVRVQPTGLEKVGAWLNLISPLLLAIGVLGLYIEFKTPGFGLPGIVGIGAFVLYFAGSYVAGLSGLEWVILFILGLVLILIELFIYPGTMILGLVGAGMVLVSIIMATIDLYPSPGPGPGLPKLPSFDVFSLPVRQMTIALAVAAVGIGVLSRILPKTQLYRSVVSTGASGTRTEAAQERQRSTQVGQTGAALSTLRPGGKAQFGDEILDVMTQGEMLPKGTAVRIIGHSGTEAVVEAVR